jgi:hypothetical protein
MISDVAVNEFDTAAECAARAATGCMATGPFTGSKEAWEAKGLKR